MRELIKSLARTCGFDVKRIPRDSLFSRDPFKTQKLFLEQIKIPKPIIFDCGAHFGETATRYRTQFTQCLIYSFEPFPESFEKIKLKFIDDPNTTVLPMAVGDTCGSQSFYVNHDHATNSLLPRPNATRRYFPKRADFKQVAEVEVTSIDEFIKQRRIPKIDILKLDLQGGELFALKGARQALKQEKIHMLYLEATFVPHYEGGAIFHEVWNFLEQFGYTLYDIYGLRRARNGQLRQGDAIFVSTKIRSEVLDKYQQEP